MNIQKAVVALCVCGVLFLGNASFGEKASEGANFQKGEFRQVESTANSVTEPRESTFPFSTGSYSYSIDAGGRLVQSAPDGRRTECVLDFLDKSGKIQKIFVAKGEQGILLLIECGDSECGWGYLASWAEDTRKTVWATHLVAFNIGQPLLESSAAYVSGCGYVAKISLRDGQIVWQHDDLFDEDTYGDAFTSFSVPKIEGEHIIFLNSPDCQTRNTKIAGIKVHKESGTIVERISQ